MSNYLMEVEKTACEFFRSIYTINPDNLQIAISDLKEFLKDRGDAKLLSILVITKVLKCDLAKAKEVIETSDAWI